MTATATPRLYTFAAGDVGPWRITRVRTVIGAGLATAPRLDIVAGVAEGAGAWRLRGIASNER